MRSEKDRFGCLARNCRHDVGTTPARFTRLLQLVFDVSGIQITRDRSASCRPIRTPSNSGSDFPDSRGLLRLRKRSEDKQENNEQSVSSEFQHL